MFVGKDAYHLILAEDQFPIDFAAGDDFDWYLVIKDARASRWTVIVRDEHEGEMRPERQQQGTRLSQFRSIAADESAWFVGSALSVINEIVVQNVEGRVIARIRFGRR